MYFFVDEAGDFSPPRTGGDHRVAVTAAIAFTDRGWQSAQPKFVAFRASLSSTELRDGEPKWHLLTPDHRRQFCDLLHRDEGASITPVTLDLSHLSGREEEWLSPMLDRLERQPDLMLFDTAKEQVALLHRQATNLSVTQHLRLYAWAYAVHQALYHAILFLGHGVDGTSWEAISIEIDAVQTSPGSREERVLKLMLLAWLAGWSAQNPFLTIQGIHTADHPFVQNYEMETGIDLGKLVRPNLRWGISSSNDGLQMADLVAGAVYAAAARPDDQEAVAHYGYLMGRASYYGPARGPGLFSPFTEGLDQVAAKYDPLSDAMRKTAG